MSSRISCVVVVVVSWLYDRDGISLQLIDVVSGQRRKMKKREVWLGTNMQSQKKWSKQRDKHNREKGRESGQHISQRTASSCLTRCPAAADGRLGATGQRRHGDERAQSCQAVPCAGFWPLSPRDGQGCDAWMRGWHQDPPPAGKIVGRWGATRSIPGLARCHERTGSCEWASRDEEKPLVLGR
jgi:hypothetical protein